MAIWDNQGQRPIENFNFMLRVEGVFDVPCKAVHSFTKENEYDYIQEGGLNDYVHMLRKPISKPFTFTVERYAGVDEGGYNPLQEGAELMLPLVLMVSPYAGHFAGYSNRVYVFTGCSVMSREYGELDAEKSGLLTEKTQIGYRELIVMTLKGILAKDLPLWEFDKKKSTGKGTQSANTEKQEDVPADQRRLWVDPKSAINANAAPAGYDDIVSKTNDTKQRKWTDRTFKASALQIPKGQLDAKQTRLWQYDNKKPLGKGKVSHKYRILDTDGKGVVDPAVPAELRRLWLLPGGSASATKAPEDYAESKSKTNDLAPRGWTDRTFKESANHNGTDANRPENHLWEWDAKKPDGKGDMSHKNRSGSKEKDPGVPIEEMRLWQLEGGESTYGNGKPGPKQKTNDIDGPAVAGRKLGPSAYPDIFSTDADPIRRWEFDPDDYHGTGGSHIETDDTGKAVAKKWQFVKGRNADYKGKNQSAVPDTESTYAVAKKWEIDPDDPKGKNQSAIPDTDSTDAVAKKWEIDPNDPKGKNQSAHPDENSTYATAKKWEFDQKNAGGKNQSAYPDKNSTKSNPKKWAFDKKNVKGKNQSAHQDTLSTKAKDRRWKFSGKTSKGSGQISALTIDAILKRKE